MAETRASPKGDRRVRRSRAALTSAFNRLVLERGYETLAVADVARLADVGRSTFYEHYAGLDDLLVQSLGRQFAVLAQGSLGAVPNPAMTGMLLHVWENRRMASALLTGDASRGLQALLTEQFEAALSGMPTKTGTDEAFRTKLLAIQFAAGHFAVLRAWLSGRLSASAEQMAEALRSSCRGAAGAAG
jgi:AcrR family transcriptional regulator